MRKAKRAPKKKVAKRAAIRPGTKVWTRADVATLRKLYKKNTNPQIGRLLHRSVAAVAAKAGALGLKKGATRKAAPKRKKVVRKAAPRKMGGCRGC